MKEAGVFESVLKVGVKLPDRKGTPMMGELPLFVAALTLDKAKVRTILTIDKACLHATNSKGDTVIHSLIRFAPYRPEQRPAFVEMIKLIYEEAKEVDQKKSRKSNKNQHDMDLTNAHQNEFPLLYFLFRTENNGGYSPVELATKKMCSAYILIDIRSGTGVRYQ